MFETFLPRLILFLSQRTLEAMQKSGFHPSRSFVARCSLRPSTTAVLSLPALSPRTSSKSFVVCPVFFSLLVPKSVQSWRCYVLSSLRSTCPIHLHPSIVPRLRFCFGRKLWVSFSCTSCGKHPVCSCLRAAVALHISAPYSKTATTLVLKVRMILVLKLYFDDFTATTSPEIKNISTVFTPKFKKSILRKVSFDKKLNGFPGLPTSSAQSSLYLLS